MITVKSAKKTLTGNFEINGYCLLEDEKPTENIANGSKLWELNSGDKYVFDEENTEWIKIKSGGGSTVTQEVLTGPLSTIFSDNGYTEEQFYTLIDDIEEGRAVASVSMPMNGDIPMTLFASVINHSLLQISFTMIDSTPVNFTAQYYWDLIDENSYGICCDLMMLAQNSSLQLIDDSFINTSTGQETYNFTITCISDVQ